MGLDVKQDVKSKAPLASEAFVTLDIPIATSNALIYGKRDAVLVDTFLTVEQSDYLFNWIGVDGIATIISHYFGTIMDSTIMQVALPSIGREFSASINA